MSRPTFEPMTAKGKGAAVEYRAVRVQVGEVEHVLALHRWSTSEWVVSDPKSGARVCKVHGLLKGMPVHSGSFSEQQIYPLAVNQVGEAVRRVGPERFNAVLAGVVLVKDAQA